MLSTQLQSVDTKMDSMKDKLLQAVRKGGKGSKRGGKGKTWQQRPLHTPVLDEGVLGYLE